MRTYDRVSKPTDRARPADHPVMLRCPRCGLSIRPRWDWLVIEHCPRCLARARTPVQLVSRAPREPGRR